MNFKFLIYFLFCFAKLLLVGRKPDEFGVFANIQGLDNYILVQQKADRNIV